MAIKKTIEGGSGVPITNAYIRRQRITITDDAAEVVVRIYKDKKKFDEDPDKNVHEQISHLITGSDLTALLAACKPIVDDFLRNIAYPGATDA